jgi:hypothetical protein
MRGHTKISVFEIPLDAAFPLMRGQLIWERILVPPVFYAHGTCTWSFEHLLVGVKNMPFSRYGHPSGQEILS